MDMPKPMTANNYDKLAKRYSTVSKEIAEETMSDAAEDNDEVVDTSISHDCTWQRRGYSSLNGCTVAISMETGKYSMLNQCLDIAKGVP